MHPKFWLLVFGDFLRVVVSSSNLRSVTRCRERAVAEMASTWRQTRRARETAVGDGSSHTGYDNKMNNQSGSATSSKNHSYGTTPEAEVDDRDALDACLKERIGAVKGDALIKFAKGDRSRVDVRGLDVIQGRPCRWAEWRGGLATESRGEAHESTLRLTRTKGSNRHAKVTRFLVARLCD